MKERKQGTPYGNYKVRYEQVPAPKSEERKREKVTVQKWESIKAGKFKIKIAQTKINATDFVFEGVKYAIMKNLGRGRYIVKVEGPNL